MKPSRHISSLSGNPEAPLTPNEFISSLVLTVPLFPTGLNSEEGRPYQSLTPRNQYDSREQEWPSFLTSTPEESMDEEGQPSTRSVTKRDDDAEVDRKIMTKIQPPQGVQRPKPRRAETIGELLLE